MIFFDLDDTLFDYKTSQDAAAKEFAKDYADYVCVDADEFVGVWHQLTQKHMARYLSGELTFQGQRRERIREVFGSHVGDGDADNIFASYHDVFRSSWKLFPDVIPCLEALESDYSLSIITDGDHAHQLNKLKHLDIADYFEHIVTPADAGAAKPSALIYAVASSKASKDPGDCRYIGDHYEKDYLGAKAAGFKAGWLNRQGLEKECSSEFRDLAGFVRAVISD